MILTPRSHLSQTFSVVRAPNSEGPELRQSTFGRVYFREGSRMSVDLQLIRALKERLKLNGR